jgi:replicative DNA helicase
MTEQLKVQPSSFAAEEAVLGAIIKGGHPIIEKCAGWIRRSDAFYTELHRQIWDAVIELYRSHQPIDAVTVTQKISDMFQIQEAYYISGLYDSCPSTANVEHYTRIVWEKFIQRQIANSAYNVYKMSYDEYEKVNVQLDKHTQLIAELQLLAPSKKREIKDIIAETISAIEEGTNVIRFGLKQLDEPAGGMTRKEITVLGGRPGHGKTTLMINAVRTLIENGHKVVLFNREMSNVEMMKKIIVMESDSLKYADLRQNQMNGTKQMIHVTAKDVKKKYKNLIMYDDIRTLSESIREINKIKPDVVFDDYIQLIAVDSNKNDGRRFEIETIMQEYKWACKRNNCSAFLLSQLNRAIEQRADPLPRMSDYSESGVIEQTAETALFIWYGYQFDDSAYDKNESEVITAKSRYGQIGRYAMGFNGDRCKFYETVEEAYKG